MSDAIMLKIPTDQLTAPQLAELFWNLDEEQQAQFFNHLGVCAMATPSPYTKQLNSWFCLDMQMHSAANNPLMLDIGRQAMARISDNARYVLEASK